MKLLAFLSTLLFAGFGICSVPDAQAIPDTVNHPIYVGVNGGFGSTTWRGLVPSAEKQSIALSMSTPTFVTEGGGTWGGVLGYEVSPYFALEGNYLSFPDASIFFDETSLFAFENDGRTELRTHTEAVSLMAKIMMFIPHTDLRLYSSVGVGEIHRNDEINDSWLVAPAFGVGINHSKHERLMAEAVFNYIAGYGESELNPAESFIPFLYAVYFRIAYRI